MPIKLPKGFPRRKSSGNALEDLSNPSVPAASSFRVLERPASKSFDGSETLKRMSQGRPSSAGHSGFSHSPAGGTSNLNINNRGSGGTNNSASSGGHDNSSSSARFSSSSTLPSSMDAALDERSTSTSKDANGISVPPVPDSNGIPSLRAAGRAFSFGRKKVESSTPAPRPTDEYAQTDGPTPYIRERAQTESSYASESTTTPPKLLDGDLDFGSTDNFGSMFESFGNRRSQVDPGQGALGLGRIESPEVMSPVAVESPAKAFPDETPDMVPSPLNFGRSREIVASPKSWTSHDSQDGLIVHSPAMERTFSYEDGQETMDHSGRLPKSRTMPLPTPPSPTHRKRQQRRPSEGLRRSSVYASKRDSARDSTLMHDDDARLVMDSITASRRLDRNNSGYQDSDDEDNPAAALVPQSKHVPSPHAVSGVQQHYIRLDNPRGSEGPALGSDHSSPSARMYEGSANTTPRAKKTGLAHQEERCMFDSSPPMHGRSTSPPRLKVQPPPKPQAHNKIMTPAQFERYRREQEMNRAGSRKENSDASDEEGEDYEDEDDIERNRQMAKQRRKQEAHLAVYRQQMMKMTGEQPSSLPSIQLRLAMDKSSLSAPNLHNRSSVLDLSFDKPTEDGKPSDDEDDDVPLGVLAAHGFPSKNRPPSALSSGDARIQYKSESYPPPPASTSGASQAGRASGLPPFARNLPPDPYFGAGLVNPSNRESLALGHAGPGSAYGGSQPSMPPGGLVGVIAGEERARAARRGSPNAQGNYGLPLSLGMTQVPGMPPGMPQMMTPGEQATVQMSEQMNQMMQMQVQWMQQMQQMMSQGMQFGPGQMPLMIPQQYQLPSNANYPPPPPLGQSQRPMSSGPLAAPEAPGRLQQSGRAVSMMEPGPSPPWPSQTQNNRQSVAPTMMSGALGAGLSPGYPPSISPSERSNAGMPARYRAVSVASADERQSRAQSRSSTFTSGTLQPPAHGRDSRLSTSGDRRSNLSMRPSLQTPLRKAGSDDDDEEGWEEMKKKREKKKSVWRRNKKKEDRDTAALEYYDYSET